MSWLADSQMHKVGYPNLDAAYSEEDSRDAVDAHNEMDIARRVTRRHNDIGMSGFMLHVQKTEQFFLINFKFIDDTE